MRAKNFKGSRVSLDAKYSRHCDYTGGTVRRDNLGVSWLALQLGDPYPRMRVYIPQYFHLGVCMICPWDWDVQRSIQ